MILLLTAHRNYHVMLLFDLMWCHGVPHNVNRAVSLEAVCTEKLLLSMLMWVSKFKKFKHGGKRVLMLLVPAPRSSKAHHCELFIEQAPGIARLCYCGPRSQVFEWTQSPKLFGNTVFRSLSFCVDSSGWLGICLKWLVTQLLGWNPSRRWTDLLWYIYIYILYYIDLCTASGLFATEMF